MSSIRSKVVSEVAKRVLKPLFTDFDTERLRKVFALLDKQGREPRGIHVEPVALSACAAEWIRPDNCTSDRVVLYLPGGAWVLRSPRTYRRIVAKLAHAVHAKALLTFYRLAPENPFPAALNDCVEAYRYLLSQRIPPERIVVGGDSAGGNLCLGMLLALRDHGVPLPAGAFALSACTEMRDSQMASRHVHGGADPIFPEIHDHGAKDPRRQYVGGNEQLFGNPYVSPMSGDLRGLCPLFLQAGSTEVLRADSTEFVDRARAAGVDAEVEIWEGQPHVWHAMPVPESALAFEHIGDFVRRCCP
jgi:monoterpene epsilon-lactone hydrolase